MLTKKQIIQSVENGKGAQAIDGRDFDRLVEFFESNEIPTFGYELKEDVVWKAKEFSKENVIAQLKKDVDFGFQKALDQRGLSASAMYQVVKMWLWVLEDELQDFESYAQYGLPLFKAVAVKYGFDNPIGEDNGDEDIYAS